MGRHTRDAQSDSTWLKLEKEIVLPGVEGASTTFRWISQASDSS